MPGFSIDTLEEERLTAYGVQKKKPSIQAGMGIDGVDEA